MKKILLHPYNLIMSNPTSNQIYFWKNFQLGTELQIAGSFLYNALYSFDRMKNFYFEQDSFEFLYQSSVGVERLLKIMIILIEHDEQTDQDSFEKSLITHNHVELYDRIRKKYQTGWGDVHIHFFQLLADFYNSSRYDRFGLHSVNRQDPAKELLIRFIEKHLQLQIKVELPISTAVDERMRSFIGRTIGKIAAVGYKAIKELANRLQLYTYELTYGSKAFRLFVGEEYTFENEKTLRRELLIALLHGKFDNGWIDYIKNITPLTFEALLPSDYLRYLVDIHPSQDLLGELETQYKDVPFDKDRAEQVAFIGTDVVLRYDDDDSDGDNDDELF